MMNGRRCVVPDFRGEFGVFPLSSGQLLGELQTFYHVKKIPVDDFDSVFLLGI